MSSSRNNLDHPDSHAGPCLHADQCRPRGIFQAQTSGPAPSNSTNWAKPYAFQYDYSAAYSVRQMSNGGFTVGGSCESGTAPATCNGYATVIRVDSSGNLQSQTEYSYPGHPESTALNLIRPTSDGGALIPHQPQ